MHMIFKFLIGNSISGHLQHILRHVQNINFLLSSEGVRVNFNLDHLFCKGAGDNDGSSEPFVSVVIWYTLRRYYMSKSGPYQEYNISIPPISATLVTTMHKSLPNL
jgi:hypothetical protein